MPSFKPAEPVAMQKVEGSSPFSRSLKRPAFAGLLSFCGGCCEARVVDSPGRMQALGRHLDEIAAQLDRM
jgi:hypothetical protein